MKIGILGKSLKENEKRIPLHLEHIKTLTESQLESLYFEENYPGIDVIKQTKRVNICSRKEIFEISDMIIIPKPTRADMENMHEGQILWGWPHMVQGHEITQYAIDKKLTIIAWENMFSWDGNVRKNHVFARNNEIAGYAAVNHFMQLKGITAGVYGKELKIAVLGFGSTSRGAINALLGQGAVDITVFSKRSKFQIDNAIMNVKYSRYMKIKKDIFIENINANQILNNFDLIVNCILQNPLDPIIFLNKNDLTKNYYKKMIIDISCDAKMGFDFAIPTSFENPIIETDEYIYYAVDHTPAYYWESASYEISGALSPFLSYIIDNNTYKGNIILDKAIDIEDGIIKNNNIIVYQRRQSIYPYKYIKN